MRVAKTRAARRQPAASRPSRLPGPLPRAPYWSANAVLQRRARCAFLELSRTQPALDSTERGCMEFQREKATTRAASACGARTPSCLLKPRGELSTAARTDWFVTQLALPRAARSWRAVEQRRTESVSHGGAGFRNQVESTAGGTTQLSRRAARAAQPLFLLPSSSQHLSTFPMARTKQTAR